MSTLMQASNQWASRPQDERFANLHDMQDAMRRLYRNSQTDVVSNRKLQMLPVEGNRRGLQVGVDGGALAGMVMEPTHKSFGQLCSLASPGNSPAGYFRDSNLPAAVIADCLNHNLRFNRDVESVGILGSSKGTTDVSGMGDLRAATGPNYGRVWNSEVVDALVERFGDGISGAWRVPGEFGKRVTVDKQNTTLFASDRDMFVFLADEDDRIETAGRSLARGFFVWNSEVGDTTLGLGFFLFDSVCCNRIVWGADKYTEVRVRHTKGAPDRWLEEIQPVLTEYANGSSAPVVEAIEQARQKKLDEDEDAFIAARFGKRMVEPLKAISMTEEGHPIENVWDLAVAATAHARSIPNTNDRLEIERTAGQLLQVGTGATARPRSMSNTARSAELERLADELQEVTAQMLSIPSSEPRVLADELMQ
jgi:hypothetical protein